MSVDAICEAQQDIKQSVGSVLNEHEVSFLCFCDSTYYIAHLILMSAHMRPTKKLHQQTLHFIVEAQQATPQEKSHKPSNVGKEAICVVYDIVFLLLICAVHDFEPDAILALGSKPLVYFFPLVCI